MKFREHRGSYEESMATVIEVESLADVERLMAQEIGWLGPIVCELYCFDSRNNWNTWIVTLENGGGILGFSNGELK